MQFLVPHTEQNNINYTLRPFVIFIGDGQGEHECSVSLLKAVSSHLQVLLTFHLAKIYYLAVLSYMQDSDLYPT